MTRGYTITVLLNYDCLWLLLVLSLVTGSLTQDAPEWIYTPPAQMTGVKGSTLNIQCTAIGIPSPVLTWFKDGQQLRNTEKIKLNNTHLQLHDLSQDSVGRYKCMAANGYGHIVYTTAVILEGGTLIKQFPRNQTVSEGQAARFECVATADPNNITYTWYKDGININSLNTFKKRVNIHGDGSLNFNTVRQDDVGTYKCVAWNGIGSWFSAEAYLTITYTPKVDKTPTNLYFAIGQPGTINCPVSANPPVTHVDWRKYPSTSGLPNGLIDLESPRYSVTEEFSLVIQNVTHDDTGVYTCVPHNEYGQGISDGIQVWAKDPPYFTIKPNPDYFVKTHDSISIPCQAKPPASNQRTYRKPTMTWQKVRGVMPDSTRIRVEKTGNLTIYDVQKEDGGQYECVATFDEVSAIANVKLVIESTTPHIPYNVTVVFGHFDAAVSWKPGFDGGFPQNYVVSFRTVGNSNARWQSLPGHNEHPEYTIYGLNPDTHYEIRVLSRNKLGDGVPTDPVSGKTLGYVPGTVDKLPTNALGEVIFPEIVKSLGPSPAAPLNISVRHEGRDEVIVRWQPPLESPVPILYYRVEYMSAMDSLWQIDKPVLANETHTKVSPPNVDKDQAIKYYFRVRSYGLLANSDYTEAKILFLPSEMPSVALSQGAIIGIAFAALIFVGMIVIAIVVVLDLIPCDRKQKSLKDEQAESNVCYSKAATITNGSSQWQSYYPYHGGRFALDDEADDIFVVENSKQNTMNTSSDKDEANERKEQGWYFPRDGHPETDLIHTDQDTLNNDNYNAASSTKASNYATYNGLMHGYYDARAGIQMSPSIRNFPYSGFELHHNNAAFDHDLHIPYYYTKDHSKIPYFETHPIQDESQHISLADVTGSGWFAPYAHEKLNDKGLNPMNINFNQEHEVVLRPSLPRHSSLKPSTLNINEEDLSPFDPSLSTVRETDTPYHQEVEYYNFPQTNKYPYCTTTDWVNGQSSSLIDQQNNNIQRSSQSPYTQASVSPVHVICEPYMTQSPSGKPDLEHRSSVGSSIQEMKSHYNRDRLLGTVERVRSNSSRSRRPGSYTSANSFNSQLSPIPQNGHHYQYSPFLEHEPERYPELTSPVYYNNNNNRQMSYTRRPSLSPQVITRETSRQTSGLGTTWSHSKIDSSTQTRGPALSVSSPLTPFEYDISNNYLPAHYRYFGLYARPKTPDYIQQQQTQGSQKDLSWKRYNTQHYMPSESVERVNNLKSPVNKAPSDSVDENYEFDPILIDTEPQDFFHIHDDIIKEESIDNWDVQRPPLYAEKRHHSPTSSEQYRFEKLRQEYLHFRERQTKAKKNLRVYRLESDIL